MVEDVLERAWLALDTGDELAQHRGERVALARLAREFRDDCWSAH
jgi:hypothetical protein